MIWAPVQLPELGQFLCLHHPAHGRPWGKCPCSSSNTCPGVGWWSGWQWETWWGTDGCREDLQRENCTYAGISLVRWLENKETRTLRRDRQTETDEQQLDTDALPRQGVSGESKSVQSRWMEPKSNTLPLAAQTAPGTMQLADRCGLNHRQSNLFPSPQPVPEHTGIEKHHPEARPHEPSPWGALGQLHPTPNQTVLIPKVAHMLQNEEYPALKLARH